MCTVTFPYTGASDPWTVPAGVNSITVDLYGAQGGGTPGSYTEPFSKGRGGHLRAAVDITALGQSTLTVRVGQQGPPPGVPFPAAAFNGGGAGAAGGFGALSNGGAGGGASDVRVGGDALADRILVAGGGGGLGGNNRGIAGDSGSGAVLAGNPWPIGGGGGTQSAGGIGYSATWPCTPPSPGDVPGQPGGNGVLGAGGAGGVGGNDGGGGGGGGYYGGGGGSGGFHCAAATGYTGIGGGGGGSSHVAPVSGVDVAGSSLTEGVRLGNGLVTITYVIPVNTTADEVDAGGCELTPGDCTLREAILAANASAGVDTITFDIPGPGDRVIVATSALPNVADAVVIDGSAQVDGSGLPLVRIDGASAGSVNGLTFSVPGTTASRVERVAFTRWTAGFGLNIGGTAPVTVHGSIFGTNAASDAGLGNGAGINVGNASTIGGTTPADRNVIVGGATGIATGGPATVQGNWIGLAPDGTTVIGASIHGLRVEGTGATIGGTAAGAGNTITGNAVGIRVQGSATANTIRGNSITANSGLGIKFGVAGGVTPNDPGDIDTGPNGLQNFPVITAAVQGGATLTVAGSLDSVAGPSYTLDFYVSSACHPSGNGEGATYVGSTVVPPGGFSGVALPSSAGAPNVLTATATGPDGTSEFSACRSITAGGSGGTLLGSVATSGGSVDLTAAGSTDWAVWGYGSGGTSTSLTPDVRKAGGAAISALTDINPTGAPRRGLGQFPAENPLTFSWSNGGGPPSSSGAYAGIQHDGQPGGVGTLNGGFSFTAPADTTPRTLRVWVSAHSGTGRLRASLSDGSAPLFEDSSVTGPFNGANVPGVYTLNYAAAGPGATLNVQWIETVSSDFVFFADNVAIYAAALSAASTDPTQTGPMFTVNSSADPGDGVCTVANCTLREAINAAGTADTVAFSIPGTGVHTITPTDRLPDVGAALLDGWSQGGASNTGPPLIEIDGSETAETSGLNVNGGTTVRGLAIGGFDGYGVVVDGSGVELSGNYIGTHASGTTANPNGGGGVYVNDTEDTLIGGTTAQAGNVISGNGGHGIEMPPAYGYTIQGNLIGVAADGTTPLGNAGAGIFVESCCGADGTVGGTAPGAHNVIAHNGAAGIVMDADGAMTITGNSIHDNGGLGIDLGNDGVTSNDLSDGPSYPADQDSGPNGLQNFPVISSATVAGGQVTIGYSLETTPGATYRVEFFASGSADALGHGEGSRYLGSDSITLEAGDLSNEGSVTLTPPVAVQVGDSITATATDAAGNTSEFSSAETAESGAPPVVTGLTLTGPPTADAGATVVPLAHIPPFALVVPQTSGTQAAPVNQSPVNQSPVNQLPVNQLPVNQSPVNQSPVNQLPVNQSPVNQSGLDFRSLALAPGPLGDTALSTIPLLREGGWGALLTGTPLATTPLQSVTLRDVLGLSPLPGPLQPSAPNPLVFADIDFTRSPLGSLPAMTLALGELPLSGIPGVDWCALFSGPPLSCTGSLPANTSLLSAALEGAPVNQSPVNQSPVNQSLINALAAAEAPVNQLPVNQLPVNQLPVNQLPVNQSRILSFPVNQLPVNQSPVNQLSLKNILLANVPVNQSPVNQLPVNQLPVNQSLIDCTQLPPELSCATATLGDVARQKPGAINVNAKLVDLRDALAPGDVPDDWTIANLEEFGTLIVGDLLESLPQPNDLTLADVLALALFANNPESFAFETLNIFDTSLSLFAVPLGAAPYTVDFTLTPDGGPTGVPADLAVSVRLPRTFAYAPGSSKLVQSPVTCGTGTPVDDPALTRPPASPGVTKATWSVIGNVGSSYTLCFSARPGIVLGPQSASATAQPDLGTLVSATAPEPVTVLDGTEASNNGPGTAPTLATSNLYLSYLTSAADVDYYRIPVPQAGARVTLHLSHLPADYDLVVYGPQQTPLRPASASTPPLDGAPVTDTGSELTHVTDALPSQTLDDLRLQQLPLVGVSASRGTDPEDITVLSDGSGGFYTVQVTSYNGATSPDPYMLRATTEPPRAPATVPARTVGGATGTVLGVLPAGFNTLFLVNRQRLQSFYPGTGPGTGAGLLATLAGTQASFQTLGFPNAVLSVDAYPAVQSAYAAWDANPGNPDLANKVVAAINSAVDTIRAQPNGAGLKYLVIVGGDRIVPQGRLGDFTTTANENGYADTFDRSSDLYALLHAGQVLSDDPYGTLEPVPYLNRQLYIPRLAVGRLVETPAEIEATLTRFGAFQGRLNPSTSLTTGYDFMKDGAAAIAAPFASRLGAGAATLISDSWTKSSLIGGFLPSTPGGSPSITSLNGHADHYEFAPPSVQPPFFTTADLPVASSGAPAGTGALVNRLVFSMGCHSGLAVSDAVVTASTYDWPQAYARNGVGAYLGNTGFGYGDSVIVAYSEQLDSIFAAKIAAGSTVGNALAAAKQEYFGSLGVFGVYDEKAMAEFTLYGLPMWSVTLPGGGVAPASAAVAPTAPSGGPQLLSVQAAAAVPTSTAVVTDTATGLQAEAFVLDGIANTPQSSPRGSYWKGPDGVQATHFRPLQPKAFVDVTGASGHGALITELRQQGDIGGVDPVFARPIVDAEDVEPELAFGDVAFPARLQALRTFRKDGTLVQRVVLMTGQFFTGSSPGTTGTGVQRLYTRIGARVLRSPSNDFVPPAFTRIDATGVDATAAFAVDVTDRTQTGGAGVVKRVLVALRAGPATTWTFADLGQVGSTARWSGGIPLPNAGSPFEYFVQAVDAAGNVGVSTNKGFYFAAAAPSAPTGGVTVAPASTVPPSGWFAGPTGVTVDGPADVNFEVSVDGGPFAPVPAGSGPTVTGDGVHMVAARGSNGGAATTVVAIDTAPPAITIGSPVAGANYYRGSSPSPVDFTCTDAGSGVKTCVGSALLGSPLPTSTLGPKSFTVNATDNLGKPATGTVSYAVSELCVGPAPPGAIVSGNGNDTLNGTPGDDVIVDTGGNNKIDGKGGNDTICSGSGNDTIVTGNGNDTVVDTGGNNTITSGGGDDRITSQSGNDKIDAGDGNDTVTDAGGNNTVNAGSGNDRVTTGTGNDKITAGDGDDVVTDAGGNNTVDVGGGSDNVTTGGGNDVIEGGSQNDTINAGNGNNTVNAGSGDDRITTGSGNDTIDGGPGYDICIPGSGNNNVKNCEG